MSDDFESGPDVSNPGAEPVAQTPAAQPDTPRVPSMTDNDVDMDAEPHKLDPKETDEEAAERDRDRKGRFSRRSRKNWARPEDVPRIRELTAKVRDLEAKLSGGNPQPKAAESTTQQTEGVKLPPSPPAFQAGQFPEPEPKIDDFDDYEQYIRASTKWDIRREAWEAQQQQAQQQAQQAQQMSQQQWAQMGQQFVARRDAFAASNPEFLRVAGPVFQQPVTPVIDTTLLTDPRGPEKMLYLAKNPATLHEYTLLTATLPVTEATVETFRRLLDTRLSAGTTGAAPTPVVTTPVPRPPTPVRTGPMKTGEALPDPDDDSESGLEAHAKQFGYGYGHRRRRA